MSAHKARTGSLRFAAILKLQVQRLRDQGPRPLLGMALKGLKLLAAIPVVLFVRLLKPLYTVRVVQLRFERIGHMVMEPELYLSRRDLGMIEPSDLEVFYPFNFYRAPVANEQLWKMWHRTVRVMPAARWFDVANRLIPGGSRHLYEFGEPRDPDVHAVLSRTGSHLTFTVEEQLRGSQGLKGLGIPEDAPFVCFLARDSLYLSSHQPTEVTYNARWGYRDADIDRYNQAVLRLTELGYYALRMGAVVEKPLTVAHPMVIDYALKGRSDFMDVFLTAHCAFYIGDTAGLWAVPSVFRRPIVFVNMVPMQHAPTWGANDLFIFKKLWCRKRERYLSLREIFDMGLFDCGYDEIYERSDVEVHQNSPEDIESLVLEMHARLNGAWHGSEEDEQLQQRFWLLYRSYDALHRTTVSRIGAEFLRTNRELLT